MGTTITVLLTLAAGVPLRWVAIVGVGELVLKPLIYFLHERFWYKYIKFGLKKP